MNKVLILTALPFKKQGNQSLARFARLFLRNGINVEMWSSCFDLEPQKDNEWEGFSLVKVPSLHEFAIRLKAVWFRLKSDNSGSPGNRSKFHQIRSSDILLPYGEPTFSTFFTKWVLFSIYLIDNFGLVLFMLLFKRKILASMSAVIGYECGYTIAAKMIATVMGKPYVNKFQGTILRATDGNISQAIKFFPLNYFGLNKADLCIMVNDGTRGDYFAYLRGNRNVLFQAHGVADQDYGEEQHSRSFLSNGAIEKKFLMFNNASKSEWKRVDRIIRALQHVDSDTLENLVFISTYTGDDLGQLEEYVKDLGLSGKVFFLHDANHIVSNLWIRNSNILITTNDVSNLGNPALEAVYYGIPIVSVNDGSLDGFVVNEVNGILIDLNPDFDRALSKTIEKLVKDSEFYKRIRLGAQENSSVHSLEVQQKIELDAIKSIVNSF